MPHDGARRARAGARPDGETDASPAHLDGSPCAAGPVLRGLHPTEIAVALDALTDTARADLAQRAGIPMTPPLRVLRDELARRLPTLAPGAAHEVARYLTSPLLPALAARLDRSEGSLAEDLEAAVLALLDEWPPTLVRLLLTLTWETAGLPAEPFSDDGE